jgi:hypothetical protein
MFGDTTVVTHKLFLTNGRVSECGKNSHNTLVNGGSITNVWLTNSVAAIIN